MTKIVSYLLVESICEEIWLKKELDKIDAHLKNKYLILRHSYFDQIDQLQHKHVTFFML